MVMSRRIWDDLRNESITDLKYAKDKFAPWWDRCRRKRQSPMKVSQWGLSSNVCAHSLAVLFSPDCRSIMGRPYLVDVKVKTFNHHCAKINCFKPFRITFGTEQSLLA